MLLWEETWRDQSSNEQVSPNIPWKHHYVETTVFIVCVHVGVLSDSCART